MPITISVVEDDGETRQSLMMLLGGAPNVQCLGSYATGEEAIAAIPTKPPNVALVDINLPGMSGIECVALLTAQLPQLRVLMLTTYEDTERIFDSLRAGASGYLLKKTGYGQLIEAVEQIHAGGAPMSMQIARQVVDYFHQNRPPSPVEELTRREQEILALIAQGYHNKEIADRLDISANTVSNHLQHIYEKLHVQSRTAAAAKFFAKYGNNNG